MVKIYGHRGCCGLINENTIISHKLASKMNVDMIDMDVVLSNDNIPIVFHDFELTMNKHFNRNGNILNKNIPVIYLNYSELKKYYVGYPFKLDSNNINILRDFNYIDQTGIPTLKESIENIILLNKIYNKNIGIQIELKTDPLLRSISSKPQDIVYYVYKCLIDNNFLNRINIEIQAFEWKCLSLMKKLDKKKILKYNYITDSSSKSYGYLNYENILYNNRELINYISDLKGDSWSPYEGDILNEDDIIYAHLKNINVITWSNMEKDKTDFNEECIKDLIKWNIDGIITDRPDKLKDILIKANSNIT